MGFDDYLKAPQVPATNTEEKAIIEKIEQRLIPLKRILRENRMTQVHLQMLISFVRVQLTKIYGKDSEIPQYFAPIREKLNPAVATEIASALIERIENFIRLAHDIGTLSFVGRKRGRVFIGHGRSPLWHELKDFLSERLGLDWDEFNREAVAGLLTFERISQMLSEAEFAFLIMTAEDAHLDKSLHARENVVHEVGLFRADWGLEKPLYFWRMTVRSFPILPVFRKFPSLKGASHRLSRIFAKCLREKE